MLSSRFVLLWLAVFVFALASTAAEPGKRPMTIEDLWKVQRVGPPTISPDGKWCAVEVTKYDIDKNDSSSQIWLLSTDGKVQKQLTHYGEHAAQASAIKNSAP